MLRRSLLTAALALAPIVASAQPVAPDPPPPAPPPEPSPEDTRSLPRCAPDAPVTPPGHAYRCRPRFATPPLGFVLDLELGTGLTDAAVPLHGATFSAAVGGTLRLTRAFGLGLRYQFLTSGDEGIDGPDADHADDVDTPNLSTHLVSLGPRARLFTDETGREAWVLEADAGWMFAPNGAVPGGPFVRASLGRQVGTFVGAHTASHVSLHLTVDQGLGAAADFRSVLVAARISPEWGIPEPRDVGERPVRAGFHYTFGAHWYSFGVQAGGRGGFGISPGVGVFFGLPVTRWLEPLVETDFLYLAVPDSGYSVHYAALAGVRLRLSGFAPLYVNALAGYQWVTGTEPLDYRSGPVMDVGFGILGAQCGASGHLGVHYRRGLDGDNRDFHGIFLVVGGAYGSLRGSVGDEALSSDRAQRCGVWTPGRAPPPPPRPLPPPPAYVPPPPPTSVPPTYTPPVVTPPVIEVTPIEIEVTLGYVLFGGMVQVQVRPELLPLARLRAAGAVTVSVRGPAGALPEVEGQLRAVLGAEGVRVEEVSSVATGASGEVRAVFTLWPPGARR